MTRRTFGCAITGAVLALSRGAAVASEPERLIWGAQCGAELSFERRYRADAQVLLFLIPLIRRQGVGGGRVVWRESTASGRCALRLLEFHGFSLPARAAGLNRLGFIREMSRIREGGIAESIYFGLMTASPEESADEARKSLHSQSKDLAYTAIEGRVAPGEMQTVIARFTVPASLSTEDRVELIERARRALTGSAAISNTANLPGAGAQCFLQALAEGLRQPDRNEAQFVYAGRLYLLSLQRSQDPKAATYFRGRGLVPKNGDVIKVSCKVRREAGGKESSFRLWVEQGAQRPLPLRFEYQAKSYLRLVFEAEQH